MNLARIRRSRGSSVLARRLLKLACSPYSTSIAPSTGSAKRRSCRVRYTPGSPTSPARARSRSRVYPFAPGAGCLTAPMSSAHESAVAGLRYDGDTVIELVTERILPSQFDDLRRNTDAIAPEGRLMLAVLEDAVHIYQRCCRLQDARSRRLFRETDEWFTSNEATSPFSFLTICQVFGFDPDYLRAGLERWRSAHGTNAGGARAIPLAIRRISGSRHRVTLLRRA
jgi:hypothetical protein